MKLIRNLLTIVICTTSIMDAMGFVDMFINEDRQGYNKYEQQQYGDAYSKFSDPQWKGLAALKNKQYDLAIDNLSMDKSINSQYNLGNAYALKGDFDNAISMYENVLKQVPGHLDAKHNLSVSKKLKQQSQNQQQNKNKDSKNKQQSKDNSSDNQQQDQDKQDQDKQDQDKQDQDKQDQDKQDQDKQDQKPQDQKEKPQNEDKQDNKDKRQKQQPEDQKKQDTKYDEKQQADEQWLRSIPDDPGGLLKRKFLRDHLRRRGN